MKHNINNNRNNINLKQLSNLLLSGLIISLTFSSCNTLFERDHSMNPEEYQVLGMPDYKKVWTNDDYVGSNITLSSLKMNDPLSLPRKNSRKSGDLFKRMVNEKNLAFIYDTTFPLRTRAYTIQYFPRFQNEMEQMYTIEYKGKIYYAEELLDLHIFGLLIHDKMLELAGIINKSDDEDVSSIKSGMEAVKYNYMKLIPRLLGELAKNNIYSAEGCEKLSKAVLTSLAKNIEWMTPENKNNIAAELKSTIEKLKSAEVKSNLENCLVVLSGQ
jgi:hypothetical protein